MLSLNSMMESWVYERSEQELVRISEVTLDSIERTNASYDEMEIIADSVGMATPYMRVSIIDTKGVIIGDSIYNNSDFANLTIQSSRPEVKQAIVDGTATSIRFARYLNADAYFYARRFLINGNDAIVRISMPIHEVNQAIETLKLMLFGFYIAALVFVL